MTVALTDALHKCPNLKALTFFISKAFLSSNDRGAVLAAIAALPALTNPHHSYATELRPSLADTDDDGDFYEQDPLRDIRGALDLIESMSSIRSRAISRVL